MSTPSRQRQGSEHPLFAVFTYRLARRAGTANKSKTKKRDTKGDDTITAKIARHITAIAVTLAIAAASTSTVNAYGAEKAKNDIDIKAADPIIKAIYPVRACDFDSMTLPDNSPDSLDIIITNAVRNLPDVDIERNPAGTSKLTARKGVNDGPSGKETWYNLDMSGCIYLMNCLGYSSEDYPYWVREDGCKMFGDYVMVAADLSIRPKGTILECSLGTAIVVDTGDLDPYQLDIAVNWK